MKWKVPVNGDRRKREHFCWFPRSYYGTCYWLTTLVVTEVYDAWTGYWMTETLKEKA